MDEAIARKAKNIKDLFRGVSKDNPHKAILGVHSEKGIYLRAYLREFW